MDVLVFEDLDFRSLEVVVVVLVLVVFGLGHFEVALGFLGGVQFLELGFVGDGLGDEDGAVGELDVAVGEDEGEAEEGGDEVGDDGAALAVDDLAGVVADGAEDAGEGDVGGAGDHAEVRLDGRQAEESDGRVVEEGRPQSLGIAAGRREALDAADLAPDLGDAVPGREAVDDEVREAARGAALGFLEDVVEGREELVPEAVPVDVEVAGLLHGEVQEGHAHVAQDEGIRKARDDGDRLQGAQGLVLAGLEEGVGRGSLGTGPEDALENRRGFVAVRGDRVDHEGPRVGRRHEVHQQQHADEGRRKVAHRPGPVGGHRIEELVFEVDALDADVVGRVMFRRPAVLAEARRPHFREEGIRRAVDALLLRLAVLEDSHGP
mmetsp:Transcript_4035/g.13164  ORF Transcript_4035/g.13164 Transcript_4035/m.13164 type:complete len:378 (+) Transcript_4035:1287-2420(+)